MSDACKAYANPRLATSNHQSPHSELRSLTKMHCPSKRSRIRSTTYINKSVLQGSASKLGRRLSGRLVTNRLTPCVYFSLVLLMHLGMLERPGQVDQKPATNQANNLSRASMLPIAMKSWYQSGWRNIRLAKYQTALAVIFCISFEADIWRRTPMLSSFLTERKAHSSRRELSTI